MRKLRLIGRLDHSIGWSGGGLTDGTLADPGAPPPEQLLGAVAEVGCASNGTQCRLLRDPLGLGKLFWSTMADRILVAARPRRLIAEGCEFESIHAIPPGTIADLDLERGIARSSRLALENAASAEVGSAGAIARVAAGIRSRLNRFFAALADAHRASEVFVCLSGGLDSTGVALLARQFFPQMVAVSFDVQRPNGQISEDRRVAERLARDLRVPLLAVTVRADDVLEMVDTVLVEGIDWRDFNVHAGLVNACLARGIAEARTRGLPERPALVLTGDLSNEFLVDYEAETYEGRTYYRLPRLPVAAQRAALIRGLETSHREIGPFEAFGLRVVLPYAMAADRFAAIPSGFLERADRKPELVRLLFGNAIPKYVYQRRKTRAQLGDPDVSVGVLAICADHGVNEACLRRRFAELHGVRDMDALARFIRGGRYRSAIPMTEAPVA